MKHLLNAAFFILLVGVSVELTFADSSLGDDRYLSEKVQMNTGSVSVRELASWLLYLAQRHDQTHKRNSEIINSLLGLPKVLNDAGR